MQIFQSTFLQSSGWEEIERREGMRPERRKSILFLRRGLPFGFHYLYCPRPLAMGEEVGEAARTIASREGSIFLKVDPGADISLPPAARLHAEPLQPQKTIILDLKKSEEEILAAMHQKTRYNIRLAKKKGVRIEACAPEDSSGLRVFLELLKETARRNGFHLHPQSHYQNLLNVRSENFSNELFFARGTTSYVAAAIVNFYRPAAGATYLHGASSGKERNLMASHLLHWEIIREAQRRGLRTYDFWGIDEKRWPGLTRFKKGFGGETVSYPPSFDIIYRPFLHRAYRMVKSWRQ